MAEKTPPSPDSLQLRGAPMASARLSKRAALVAVAVLAGILGVIIMNISKGPKKAAEEEPAAKRDLEPALAAARTLTKDVPDVVAAPTQKEIKPPPLTRAGPPTSAPVRSSADEARLADSAIPKFSSAEATGIQPAVAGMSAEDTSPYQGSNGYGQGAAGASPGLSSPGAADTVGRLADTVGQLGGAATGGRLGLADAGRLGAAAEQIANEPDLNRQTEKLAFLRKSRKGSYYLNSRLTAPVSPYELKTGTVIPGILITAMNSDLPGEIVAQVSQNVYDTASGNHLLIPQGTRLFGHYDSQVTFGQGRLLVSWDRLIYPNSYTLDLGGMNGHDQEGTAGFHDRVNNHYARIFGWALMTSVLSAGYQLSQPQQTSLLSTPSNQQIAAAAVGQQMAQLGAEIARRNMQVQPTIEVRKGYRFNVMVNKDVVFPGSYQP